MRTVYRTNWKPAGFAAALLVVLMLAAGCGVADPGKDPSGTTLDPVSSTTTIPAETSTTTSPVQSNDMMTLNVYFARGEEMGVAHRTLLRTEAAAQAAMEQLLAGPTAAEQEWGFSTSIPEGSALLGVTIENGIAAVDLSADYEAGGGTFSMTMRLAQVVFTLTQFPTVEAVAFLLEGEPVTVFSGEGLLLERPQTRADLEHVTPAILVENVAPGDTVRSPVRLTGTANTFEATFMITITDWDGRIVYEDFATATSGSGTRGTFDVTVPFEVEQAGMGAIIVWEESAKDGSQINVVEIPVRIEL